MQTAYILTKTSPHLACLALFLLAAQHEGSQVTVFSENFDGTVQPYTAAIKSNVANTYAYTTVPSSTGVHYYRITAVEEDGHFIISTDGKIIIEQDEALHAGTNSLDVDPRNFPPGI